MSPENRSQEYRDALEKYLKDFYSRFSDLPQKQLFEAISYSLLAGGKRIRPNLLYETLKGYGKQESCGDEYAAAMTLCLLQQQLR